MCLYVKSAKEGKKEAKKPIAVYKVMVKAGNCYASPYMGTKCNVGDTLKGKEKEYYFSLNAVNELGVHAYKNLTRARASLIPFGNSVNSGEYFITKWEIPKGAYYWEGTGESILEIAATEMKFIEVIEKFDNEPKSTFGLAYFPGIDFALLNLSTHYMTDQGKVKPIKENINYMDTSFLYRLCWKAEHVKKYIPEKITTYDGIEYMLSINQNKNTGITVSYVGIGKNEGYGLYLYSSELTEMTYAYLGTLRTLIYHGYIKEEDLK